MMAVARSSVLCSRVFFTLRLLSSSPSSSSDSLDILSRKAKYLRGRLRYPAPDAPKAKPLVVLVGWVKATHKSLEKYAALYNTLGATTLSVIPSLLHVWNVSSYDKYTSNVFRTINTTYNGPILLHLFSGGAGVVLPSFTQITGELSNISLKGIVFDSGPTLFVREIGMAAAKATLAQGGMNRLMYYVAIGAGNIAEQLMGSSVRQDFAEALKRPALSVPQLYLYSNTDQVASMRRIEAVMEQQRVFGREVEGVVFEGASHVRLLVSDPDKYIKHISSFMDKISQ